MKNLFLSLALLCLAGTVMSQTGNLNPAQEATEQLVGKYQLDQKQKAEMLKIQERKYRNLAEIEDLKPTDPQSYIRKIRSLQYANDMAMQKLLNDTQLALFRQQKADLRKQKAEVYKVMKTAGASQNEIDWKICEMEEEALLQG